MLNVVPHAWHSLQIRRDLHAVPHLLRVVLRRDVLHPLRQAGAKRHDVGRTCLSADVVRNLSFEYSRTRGLDFKEVIIEMNVSLFIIAYLGCKVNILHTPCGCITVFLTFKLLSNKKLLKDLPPALQHNSQYFVAHKVRFWDPTQDHEMRVHRTKPVRSNKFIRTFSFLVTEKPYIWDTTWNRASISSGRFISLLNSTFPNSTHQS